MTNWECYNRAYGNGNVSTEKAVKLFLKDCSANICFICPARKFCGECDLDCDGSFTKWATAEHRDTSKDTIRDQGDTSSRVVSFCAKPKNM
jgi:hypothetical protein